MVSHVLRTGRSSRVQSRESTCATNSRVSRGHSRESSCVQADCISEATEEWVTKLKHDMKALKSDLEARASSYQKLQRELQQYVSNSVQKLQSEMEERMEQINAQSQSMVDLAQNCTQLYTDANYSLENMSKIRHTMKDALQQQKLFTISASLATLKTSRLPDSEQERMLQMLEAKAAETKMSLISGGCGPISEFLDDCTIEQEKDGVVSSRGRHHLL